MATAPQIGSRPSAIPAGDSWLRPELVLITAPVSYKDWTVAPSAAVQVLTPNPRRIGIVFLTALSSPGGTLVGAGSDVSMFGFPVGNTERTLSFSIDDVYSLVGGGWWVYNNGGVTIRVYEFVKPA